MTKLDKQMLGIFIILIIIFGISVFWAHKSIENVGGIKQITIDVGKDIKDVIKEIQKH